MTLDPRHARAWLDDHTNLETGVGVPARGGVGKRLLAVERERPLMDLLGSPEGEYPVVHLTGTNGKTSVARMTAALLEAAGLSVGAYTSPHLARVNERIVWNGDPIANERDLQARFNTASQMQDQPEIHLKPNRLAPYKDVAHVMADAQRLGMTKLGLVGQEQFMGSN